MSVETPVSFYCDLDELIGIIHQPSDKPFYTSGVLIVVGGPQYRAGSHRQFVSLARDLARAGIPAMRFDYRGMGDSQGEQISFEDAGPDIKAAIDTFMLHCPQIKHVVLWGLCDAASACLMYSVSDDRVTGLVLANPWVRSEAGAARAHLKHYYTARFFQKEFWKKLLQLKFNYATSFSSLLRNLINAFSFIYTKNSQPHDKNVPFQKKMETAFADFTGKILFIISGNDLTAAEFTDMVNTSKIWKKQMKCPDIAWVDLEKADHTFSKEHWKTIVSDITIKWIQHK